MCFLSQVSIEIAPPRANEPDGGAAQRGTKVRAIEYENVPTERVGSIGSSAETVLTHLRTLANLAILRGVDDRGEKFTAVGDPEYLQALLASGEAGSPAGMKLQERRVPVIFHGLRQAS